MNTVYDLLRNSALPMLESQMLMQQVMGFSRVQLISRDDTWVSDVQLSHWHELVNRRVAGEPMAYILGKREFFGRDFEVSSAVLIPRPDTEILVEVVLDLIPDTGLRVLDLGTGSGAIALTLAAERPQWQVTGVDVCPDALAVARRNAARFGLYSPRVTWLEGSWFAPVLAAKSNSGSDDYARFDVVVSNPPYIAAQDVHLQMGDLRFEPRGALTDEQDGLSHYRSIVAQCGGFLAMQAWLVFEHGFDQGAAVRALLQASGFTAVRTVADLAGLERVTLGQWLGEQEVAS